MCLCVLLNDLFFGFSMSSNIRIQRLCVHCGNEFTAKTTVTKFCSNKCTKAVHRSRKRNEKIQVSNEQTFRIKAKPIEALNGKQFLTVSEVALLMDCSKRTVYRLIAKGNLSGATNLSQRLTRIKRSELDKLFEHFEPVIASVPIVYEIEDCYGLREVREKYSVSETTLYELMKKHKVPTIRQGWYAYVPKTIIDKLLADYGN